MKNLLKVFRRLKVQLIVFFSFIRIKWFLRNSLRLLENNIQISIVMTSYNKMPYLKKAVNSVLSQGGTGWELIVWDDGSNDGSREFLQSLNDDRIHVIFSEHSGQLKALKNAIEATNGKYIMRLDADDELLRGTLSLLQAFTATGKEVYYFDLMLISEKSRYLQYIPIPEFDCTKILTKILETISSPIPDHGCWRRDYIEIVMHNYAFLNVPYYLPLLKGSHVKPEHIPLPVYCYRIHQNNFLSDINNRDLYWQGKVKTIHYLGTQLPDNSRILKSIISAIELAWENSEKTSSVEPYYNLWCQQKTENYIQIINKEFMSVVTVDCKVLYYKNWHVIEAKDIHDLDCILKKLCIDLIFCSQESYEQIQNYLKEQKIAGIPLVRNNLDNIDDIIGFSYKKLFGELNA